MEGVRVRVSPTVLKTGSRPEYEGLRDQVSSTMLTDSHRDGALQAGSWPEMEGVRDRLVYLEVISQKALKASVDMEIRISKMENKCSSDSQQSEKMLEDIAARLVDFGVVTQELPPASELHAAVARTKLMTDAKMSRFHELEELTLRLDHERDGRLVVAEDHMKSLQQKLSSLEATVGASIRQLMQDQKHVEVRLMEKFNDLRTRVSIEQEMLAGKLEKDTKYEAMLGTIDRSIHDIRSKLNEKVCRSDLHEVVTDRMELTSEMLRSKTEEQWRKVDSELRSKTVELQGILDEKASRNDLEKYGVALNQRYMDLSASMLSIRKAVTSLETNFNEMGETCSKRDLAQTESAVSDFTESLSYLTCRLEEKASRAEVKSITCKLEDFERSYALKLMEPWRKFDSDLHSKTEESWHKFDSGLRSKPEECHKPNSEWCGKIVELQDMLHEKASKKDLEKYSVALNQSCRDLSKSILAVRQEVTSLETNFNEMGQTWSKRDREFVNLSNDWSRREEKMLQMGRQWSDWWEQWERERQFAVNVTVSPRRPPHPPGAPPERRCVRHAKIADHAEGFIHSRDQR